MATSGQQSAQLDGVAVDPREADRVLDERDSTGTASEATGQETDSGMPKRARQRYRKFALRVLLIFAPVHFYVGWSLLPDLPVDPAMKVLGAALLAVSTFLIPYGTLAVLFFKDYKVIDRMVWAGSLTMGWFSSLLVFTLVRDLVLLIPDMRAWSVESTLVVLAASLLVTLIGFFNARRLAKVVHVTIPLAKLPPELDGFTIAQITDVHVGPTIKGDYVRGIVERVNTLDADVIAITGDMVDGKVERLSQETAPLADLKARYGAFAVTGNHEYYSGADEWMGEFRRLGLRPLMNEHVVIAHNDAELVIAGINDYNAARVQPSHDSDPVAAAEGTADHLPKILLAHQPRSAHAAAEAGFDLQLSGHTHGGQFWPWNHFVRMQQPFTAGLRRLGDLWVYTSRGTGYWGPPKRFGAPSEITLIKLTTAA